MLRRLGRHCGRLGSRCGRDLGRGRRPGDVAFLDHREAADGFVFHVDVDDAVLLLAPFLGQPEEIVAVQRGGLLRQPAGEIGVADDRDAVSYDGLARLGQLAVAAVLFLLIGAYAPTAFLGHFTVFVLACFVGYMVIWNVTPALHTPLMSVTNAISSIIAIGALVQIAPPLLGGGAARPEQWIHWLAWVGIALTAINMFGGFAVTQRMLQMFRK